MIAPSTQALKPDTARVRERGQTEMEKKQELDAGHSSVESKDKIRGVRGTQETVIWSPEEKDAS